MQETKKQFTVEINEQDLQNVTRSAKGNQATVRNVHQKLTVLKASRIKSPMSYPS